MSESGARAPLRVAVIGAGLMGHWHGSTARLLGHTVNAVFDTDVARARPLAAALGASCTTTLAQAFDVSDVVHVCTPMSTHARIVEQALDAGRHVICEKPLAVSAAEVRMLHGLAAARGVLLVPTHQFVFQRGITQARNAAPTLGDILHIDLIACTAGATGRDANGAESVAMEVLPHPLSLVELLLPGALVSTDWQVANTPLGELRVMGKSGTASIGILVSCGGRPPINQLRLICSSGTVVADLFHGFAGIDRGGISRREKITRPFTSSMRMLAAASANLARRGLRREPAYPGLRELVEATYSAAIQGRGAPISARESISVAEAGERIRDLRNGQRIAAIG